MALPIRRRGDDVQRTSRAAGWSPFDPFPSIEDMYQRMGQLMRTVGHDVGPSGFWSLPVDVEETDDGFVVEVDMPGVARDDLTIDWSGRELTLHGEVKERERSGFLRQQTRRVGKFHYTVTLPGEVDGDNITAELEDGVLTVRAPKSQGAKPRRIEIGGRKTGSDTGDKTGGDATA